MRRGCITLGKLRAAALCATAASLARADTIYLSPVGQQNLEIIRLRIAPAPVFEDPARKLPYIRCVIVGERAARNPSAPTNEAEGRPDYDLVAFDAGGEKRSATVSLNAIWINRIEADIDTDLDVRWLFSNRDQTAGVALASRAYFALARRAVDPQGRLGLWRNDLALPPEPAGVKEGALIRFLLDPPILDASGSTHMWDVRKKAEWIVDAKDRMARRLPLAHPADDVRPTALAISLLDAIARERAHRLSRAGFDRTALGMLVFLFDLAGVKHHENPVSDNAADAIHLEGVGALEHAINTITAATSGAAGHAEPPALMALAGRHAATDHVEEKRKIAAEFEALQVKLAAAPRMSCAIHRQFCVDESQRAAAAIDALMACEGIYAAPTQASLLAQRLLELLADNPYQLNFHRHDRVDLRPAALRLLAQLLNPPASPHADRQQQRREVARQLHGEFHAMLTGNTALPIEQEAVRRALAAGGWGTAEELQPLADVLLENALLYSADAVRDPGRARVTRELAAQRIATLRPLAELAASQAAAERTVANTILGRIERMRADQRKKETFQPSVAVFLELWDAPPAAP